MAAEEVFNFFIERHIVLQEEWLQCVIKFLIEKQKLSHSKICDGVYEQWLYSDLCMTTYPIFEQLGLSLESKKVAISSPFVAQLRSIVDIGSSMHSQYSKLTYEFIDNTGFEIQPEQEESQPWEKKKRMLMMELGDGEKVYRAIELCSIPQLSLLTRPGCKILLIPPFLCRKGIFLLRERNCFVLGGDVEELMNTGRPVEVTAKKLGITLPNEKVTNNMRTEEILEDLTTNMEHCEVNRSLLKTTNQVLLDSDFEDDYTEPVPEIIAPDPVIEDVVDSDRENSFISRHRKKTVVVETIQVAPENHRRLSSDFYLDTGRKNTKKSEGSTQIQKSTRLSKGCLSSVIENHINAIQLEDSPPNFDEAPSKRDQTLTSLEPKSTSKLNRKRSSILSKLLDSEENGFMNSQVPIEDMTRMPAGTTSKEVSQRSLIQTKQKNACMNVPLPDSIVPDSQKPTTAPSHVVTVFCSPPKKRSANPLRELNAVIKQEIIELSDDEEDERKLINKLSDSKIFEPELPTVFVQPTKPIDFFSFPLSSSIYGKRYNELKVVKIEEAKKRNKFTVGSTKFLLQAVILDISEALRIVDNIWTQKVKLMDESGIVSCYIDDPTLTSLIGLTAQQAMEIRKSSDNERRKDGKNRLAAVSTQMQRLDLLFDVEFFSGGLADAIVRSIRTVPQALSVFS